MHDIVSTENEWYHDQQNHINLNLAAAVDKLFMSRHIPVGVCLGNLGRNGLKDIQAK